MSLWIFFTGRRLGATGRGCGLLLGWSRLLLGAVGHIAQQKLAVDRWKWRNMAKSTKIVE
jgi:hypothetical protein